MARRERLSNASEEQERAVGTEREPIYLARRTTNRRHVYAINAGKEVGRGRALDAADNQTLQRTGRASRRKNRDVYDFRKSNTSRFHSASRFHSVPVSFRSGFEDRRHLDK